MAEKVVVENLFVNFEGEQGDFQALQDISFSVKEGEFLTILGPSGCGKSTLIRTIAGFQLPKQDNPACRNRSANTPQDVLRTGCSCHFPLSCRWHPPYTLHIRRSLYIYRGRKPVAYIPLLTRSLVFQRRARSYSHRP